MVQATELPRAFDCHHVFRFFDHADEPLVAAWVTTDRASLLLGNVAALVAEVHALAHFGEQLGEVRYVEALGLQNMKRDALGRFGANARQLYGV